MPIAGLTTPDAYDPTRSMQLIAKIKKGAPKENGLRDLDHFRFDLQPQFNHYDSVIADIYGEKPQRLDDVVFIADNPHKAFDSWFELYGAGQQLKIRCDGHMIYKRLVNHVHDHKLVPCINTPENPCGCKQIGRLSFILSKFSMQTGVYGYFTMGTHSIYDLVSIFQALMGVHEQFGNIRSVQWILERVPKEINTPKQDKAGNVTGRIKTKKYMLQLRPSEDSIKRFILPKLQENHLLPDTVANAENLLSSGNTDIDDGEDDASRLDRDAMLDDDDDGTQKQTSDSIERFTEWAQKIDANITITDVSDGIQAVPRGSDFATYVAYFWAYWDGNVYTTAKKHLEAFAVAGKDDAFSVDDALIDLEALCKGANNAT